MQGCEADDDAQKISTTIHTFFEKNMIEDAAKDPMANLRLLLYQMSPVSSTSQEESIISGPEESPQIKGFPLKKGSNGSRMTESKKTQLKLLSGGKCSEEVGHLCETCGKRFDRRYNLKVHMRRHTGETPYICPINFCSKQFKWRSSMAHHVRAHHGGITLDILGARSRQREFQEKKKIHKPHSAQENPMNVVNYELPVYNTFAKGHFFESIPACEDSFEIFFNGSNIPGVFHEMEFETSLSNGNPLADTARVENNSSDVEFSKDLDFSSSFNGFEPNTIDLSDVVRDSKPHDIYSVNPF